jgi:sensor histidine kinase YesM
MASLLAPGRWHPLDVIPLFRRFRPRFGREIVFTFVFNAGLAVIFWTLAVVFGSNRPTLSGFVWILMVTNVMGYTIHALMSTSSRLGLDRLAWRGGTVGRAVYYTLVSTVGVFAGWMLLGYTADPRIRGWFADPKFLAGTTLVSFVISAILLVIMLMRERELRAETALAAERVRAERIEREAATSQLRALQAQIEPHFLFNTLANLASLIDTDPALAKRMLAAFNRFLRASLAATRAESTTLAAEAGLLAAYLDVLQVRMGTRLRYAIEIDPALAAFTLPPMLLQPIVENAIRHGLEPRIEGGEVRIRAGGDEGRVRIEVIDTGVGFASATRGGMGLTNIRERLQLLYAGQGGMAISDNPGGGTIVTMTLPT